MKPVQGKLDITRKSGPSNFPRYTRYLVISDSIKRIAQTYANMYVWDYISYYNVSAKIAKCFRVLLTYTCKNKMLFTNEIVFSVCIYFLLYVRLFKSAVCYGDNRIMIVSKVGCR